MPDDPYADPATGVLRNKLGLTTATELEDAEREITHAALIFLKDAPVQPAYDLGHLCAIHRTIFGDVYGWAGQLRTVAIAKGSWFCLPQYIESSAAEIFRELRGENVLRGLSRRMFTERLTYYLGEVNAIHPFREGNGRAQRAFFEQLASDAVSYWTGSTSMPTATLRHPPRSCAGTRPSCGKCSTNSSVNRRPSDPNRDANCGYCCQLLMRAWTDPSQLQTML